MWAADTVMKRSRSNRWGEKGELTGEKQREREGTVEVRKIHHITLRRNGGAEMLT